MTSEETENPPVPPPDFSQETTKGDMYGRIGEVFTPAAPVSNKELFAGRLEQMADVLILTRQAGTHGVIYGERGVGKTSLASVMVNMILGRGGLAARTNCDTGDTYYSAWKKALGAVSWWEGHLTAGFTGDVAKSVRSAAELLPDQAGPGDVCAALTALAQIAEPVIFFDEFDRINDTTVRAMFADTIKMLSDQAVGATIILVGVADTVDELVAEHGSIERALVQIQMPRMSRKELEQIVTAGLKALGMTIQTPALARITSLSQGLPHYTHLISQHAATVAVANEKATITRPHVDMAVSRAIERAQRSIVNDYNRATSSPQRTTLYAEVLLAAALAENDELGYFAPADVRAPLSAILGKAVEIPSFVRHLHLFAETARGEVLQKRGLKHRYRFRFRNPLLQPYVVMHGLKEGLLDADTLEKFS
jgi:Cdc6-like AAA superfamily ATPase